MILQALDALYDRLVTEADYDIAPRGYSRQKVTFCVVLHADGTLVDIQDVRLQIEGRRVARPVRVLGGTKPSGQALNPCFLWDSAAYLLGYSWEETKQARAPEAFAAFRQKHLALEGRVRSARFDAVCAFLTSWDPRRCAAFAALAEGAATGFGVFQIRGETAWVHQDPVIDQWWRSHLPAPSGPEGQCLVSGEVGPLARTHPKIKGVTGAQGAGGALVGFNEASFESLGKEQSYNAPVSEAAAFRYTSALNELLDGPCRSKHRISLGDTTVVFWTERPSMVEDVFARFLDQGSEPVPTSAQDAGLVQTLSLFFTALRGGLASVASLDPADARTAFFILGLSPNAGRISVRFFHRSTVSDLLGSLCRHHRDIAQEPQPARGKRPADPEFPPARLLLRETAREAKEQPPLLAGALLASIVAGSDYPQQLFGAVVRRIRADREITYARACALAGYLRRNLHLEVPMSLDPDRPEPAYRLGRLFAALEKTQRDALGDGLNKTIRDSFYSSASATPASVFPRLMRTYQHHLAKLEGGMRVGRERLVQEILDSLDGLPSHLGLADQGLFAIGYYHQMRAFYTRREDRQRDPLEPVEARS